MFDRLRRGSGFLPSTTREFSIPRVFRAETGVLHVCDVTVRMSAVVAVPAALSAATDGAAVAFLSGAFFLTLTGIAGGSYVRYLRIYLK
ncbi:hypothetical protein [Streptomyces lunalinharesii]